MCRSFPSERTMDFGPAIFWLTGRSWNEFSENFHQFFPALVGDIFDFLRVKLEKTLLTKAV